MVNLLTMEIVLTKKSRQLKLLLKVDSDKMLGISLLRLQGKKLNALHGIEISGKPLIGLELSGKMRMLVTLLFRLQGRKLNALHGLETSCKKCRRRLLVTLNA